MKNIWFFIANPDIAKWEDIKKSYWKKHYGHYNWGIPNKSRDLEKLGNVDIGDIILCYVAYKKKIIGWCKCTLPIYPGDKEKENVDPDFINRIGISDINYFENPIKFDELKQMNLDFALKYANDHMGRSIADVSKNDWHKFRDRFCNQFF